MEPGKQKRSNSFIRHQGTLLHFGGGSAVQSSFEGNLRCRLLRNAEEK